MISFRKTQATLTMPASKDAFYNVLPDVFRFVAFVLVLITLIDLFSNSQQLAHILWTRAAILAGCIAVYSILKRLLMEQVIVTRDVIIHRGVWMEGRPEEHFRRDDLQSILWISEQDEAGITSYELFLVDRTEMAHLLMGRDAVYFYRKRWYRFIKRLSRATGLPVHKKTYRWYSASRANTPEVETEETFEKWQFLPKSSRLSMHQLHDPKRTRTKLD